MPKPNPNPKPNNGQEHEPKPVSDPVIKKTKENQKSKNTTICDKNGVCTIKKN